MQIFQVNRQWASRPEDETFQDLGSAYKAAKRYAETAVEKLTDASTLRVEADGENVNLVGRGNIPAKLTHWAFGQLSARAGAPASYLRELPATLAAQNLNYGLKLRYPEADKETVNLLVHANGGMLVRSFNSEIYGRIWNHELLARLMALKGHGWHNPKPFNQGEEAGTVWVSDHDMFVFQVNDGRLIEVPGPRGTEPRQLRRGFIMSNSEVGAAKWRTMTFLFDYMCCNRIIWGAQNVLELAVRHVGNVKDRLSQALQQFDVELRRYAESSASDEEARIAKARRVVIADTKEGVIDKVFGLLKGQVSRTAVTQGYDTALEVPDSDVGPETPWGLANGMTRYAQQIRHTDERVQVERAAGKLVELAF